jgi:hypothetical protein
MSAARAVSWGETAWVLMGCWGLCALGYGAVALLDDPTLPASAPAVLLLGHWWRALLRRIDGMRASLRYRGGLGSVPFEHPR